MIKSLYLKKECKINEEEVAQLILQFQGEKENIQDQDQEAMILDKAHKELYLLKKIGKDLQVQIEEGIIQDLVHQVHQDHLVLNKKVFKTETRKADNTR